MCPLRPDQKERPGHTTFDGAIRGCYLAWRFGAGDTEVEGRNHERTSQNQS